MKSKKVLLLAYCFPPYHQTGGQRPYSWYKHLKKFDVQITVVTRHWDNELRHPIDYIKPSSIQTTEKTTDEYGTIIRVPFQPDLTDKFMIKYGHKFHLVNDVFKIPSRLRYLSFMFDKTANIYHTANQYLKDNFSTFMVFCCNKMMKEERCNK